MTCFRRAIVGMIAVMALLLAGRPALGQDDPELEEALRVGVQALDAGHMEATFDALEFVFDEEPAYVSPEQGAVAYWLGHAYEQDGDLESAHEVWVEGIQALNEAGMMDPRLADRFVRYTFSVQHHDDYPLASLAYLQLLAGLDQPVFDEMRDLVRDDLEALAIILPDEIKAQNGLDRLEPGEPLRLPDGTGARLVAWWRSRDVAPATRRNERLEEHLSRVAYAEAQYRHEGTFDDRGRVYIRLGAPSRKTEIPFTSMNFRNKVVDRNLTINQSDFPENEFWIYEHVDDAAHFLFVNRGDGYRIGEVRDLLPSTLRSGLSSSSRGRAKARAAVRTLEEILRELSLFHPSFATRYQDAAAFTSLIDEAELAEETAQQAQNTRSRRAATIEDEGDDDLSEAVRAAVAASSGTDYGNTALPGGSFSPNRPDLFAQSFLSRIHVEDEQASVQRATYVPRSYTNTFDEVEPLPTIVRVARFLDEDGTTRTEVYWGAPVGALQPSTEMRKHLRKEAITPDDYMLLTTVVQKTEDYRERVVNIKRQVIPDVGEAEDVALVPQVYVAQGDTGIYHLAIQWDQYTTTLSADGQPVNLGRRIKANTFRADTLQALRADERVLEMSDLKPMVVPEQAALAADPAEAATLYPFREITPETSLLLYFEVYHLVYDADDQTRYTVEYEMTRRTDGGLLRKGEADRISAATAYASGSRTARETILLDLNDLAAPADLDVTIRVTDDVTGRQVERTLSWTLVPSRS